MKMMKVPTVVQGVQVSYDSCAHCGAEPDLQDARDALEMESKYKRQCAVCGTEIEIISVVLYHYKEKGDKECWGSRHTLREPAIEIELLGPGGSRVSAHLRCAKNAISYYDWSCVEAAFSK